MTFKAKKFRESKRLKKYSYNSVAITDLISLVKEDDIDEFVRYINKLTQK